MPYSDSPDSDRRHHPRYAGPGLMANIGGRLVNVIDISVGGARLEKGFAMAKGPVSFVLIPRVGSKLILNEGVKVTGTVAHEDDQSVGIVFIAATYALSKLIVRHASKLLKVEPHMVK
jgi:hypothetical protein